MMAEAATSSVREAPAQTAIGVDPVAPVTIAGVATALPPHRVGHDELLALLAGVWPRLARHTSLLAGEVDDGLRFVVRPLTELTTPLAPGEQSRRYAVAASSLATAAAERALATAGGSGDDIGLLVVSSCTGFVLPGVDVHLAAHLGLRGDLRRMPLTHFGCAGGAAGLALASDWVRAHAGERALVVAVEVPSLTFRPADTSPDNLLSTLVFGDGAGAAVLRGGAEPGRLCIRRTASHLVPGSTDALGYELADDGFRVIVSRRLPDLLEAHLPRLVAAFGTAPTAELDAVALHPGGRGIVDAVVRCLDVCERQVAATRTVLRGTGNTSSAGLLFVLEELGRSLPSRSGLGLAVGFGPGLTVELLELGWAC